VAAHRPDFLLRLADTHPANTSISRCCDNQLNPPKYLSIRYTERVSDAGGVTSVDSRYDSYDSARLVESVIGLYKAELIRNKGPWPRLDDLENRYLGVGRLVEQSPASSAVGRIHRMKLKLRTKVRKSPGDETGSQRNESVSNPVWVTPPAALNGASQTYPHVHGKVRVGGGRTGTVAIDPQRGGQPGLIPCLTPSCLARLEVLQSRGTAPGTLLRAYPRRLAS